MRLVIPFLAIAAASVLTGCGVTDSVRTDATDSSRTVPLVSMEPSSAKIRVDDCGPPQPHGHLIITNEDPCAIALNQCAGKPSVSPDGKPLTVKLTRGFGDVAIHDVDCAALASP